MAAKKQDAEFHQVAEQVSRRKKQRNGGMSIGVAYDGSDASACALAAAAGLHSAARGDTLTVLHVGDASKAAWLPRHLEPSALRLAAATKLEAMRVGFSSVCVCVPARAPPRALLSKTLLLT